MAEKKIKLKISGMSCEGCARTIESLLKREKGVKSVKVDYNKAIGEIVFDESEISVDDILNSRTFRLNYRAEVVR